MEAETQRRQAYREAYERWQRDLERLHRVLLDGEPLDPMHRIALIRSESHTHDHYEEARQRFLGIGSEAEVEPPFGDREDSDA